MAAFYNDGSVPYGSVTLSINSITYIADNIADNEPGKVIERTNHIDEPSGWVGVPGFIVGSATLQLATSSTTAPTRGVTFAYGGSSWAVTDVDKPKEKACDWKVNINFRKIIN
jgi:hypothetical protein